MFPPQMLSKTKDCESWTLFPPESAALGPSHVKQGLKDTHSRSCMQLASKTTISRDKLEPSQEPFGLLAFLTLHFGSPIGWNLRGCQKKETILFKYTETPPHFKELLLAKNRSAMAREITARQLSGAERAFEVLADVTVGEFKRQLHGWLACADESKRNRARWR